MHKLGTFLLVFGGVGMAATLMSGYYTWSDILTGIFFIALGTWLVNRPMPETSQRSHYRNSPEQGFRTFDPETGEELRIANGRRYHKVNGRWEELPPHR